ncbi:hypothetical protein K3495_g1801 [Podosphaera aphanis]|nr:hypothetical protein K3495_g1801 [Podosphaera aphanis]
MDIGLEEASKNIETNITSNGSLNTELPEISEYTDSVPRKLELSDCVEDHQKSERTLLTGTNIPENEPQIQDKQINNAFKQTECQAKSKTQNSSLGERYSKISEEENNDHIVVKRKRSPITEVEGRGLNKRYKAEDKIPQHASEKVSEQIISHSRYFTRSKRKREDADNENERLHKAIKAMLAQIALNDDEDDIVEDAFCSFSTDLAFPSVEINGIKIPHTYKEAINDPQYAKQWKSAIMEELTSLMSNRTWKKAILPKDGNLVSCKWVFTIKQNPDGSIERFKARLVARGFSQIEGQDYTETFAPTVRMDTLRLFIAIVAAENLECSHFDIKNAFTESDLKEEIYLAPPPGISLPKGYVLRALKSLYGLKQAARDWNLLCREALLKWGFVQSLADPCVFTHKNGVILLVYVDDIVAAAPKISLLDWFFRNLSGRFNAKNLGEIKKVLGVRVTRDRKNKTIYLDQEQYITGVLDRFGITEAQHKKKIIPVADYEMLRPAKEEDIRIDITEYQQAIGSLMYAMILTRPDIAFVLGKLSQYMSDPARHHGSSLKNLMRYLKSTVTQKLRYGPEGANTFKIYSDADWASDRTDRKSISGGVAMFYGGPISWSSKKQRSVSTSSCESEYIALSTSAKQGQWIAQVFRDLGRSRYIGKNPDRVQMYGDNQGALALVKNPHLHERSKHIDVCFHYIRDLAEKGRLVVDYIPTAEMIADGLTKPLMRVNFQKFKRLLGLID